MVAMRPDWDEYLIGVAWAVSKRGDCIRRQVGAVLVDTRTKYQLATGYNGTEPGGLSCLEGHCKRCNDPSIPSGSNYDDCIETHAEENVKKQYQKHFSPERLDWSHCSLYLTTKPCVQCLPMLIETNLGKLFWEEPPQSWWAKPTIQYLDLSLPKM